MLYLVDKGLFLHRNIESYEKKKSEFCLSNDESIYHLKFNFFNL